MAVTVTVEEANAYFSNEVLFTEEWDLATAEIRQKALNEAERRLYRYYSDLFDINDPAKQLPKPAVFEQALWMLRSESARQAELGIKNFGVTGVSMTYSQAPDYIAPEARRIISEALKERGVSYTGRVAWTVL